MNRRNLPRKGSSITYLRYSPINRGIEGIEPLGLAIKSRLLYHTKLYALKVVYMIGVERFELPIYSLSDYRPNQAKPHSLFFQ